MTKAVSAIYENGVLRLLEPLPLPEHTAVQVYVEAPNAAVEHRRRVREALIQSGLGLPEAADVSTMKPLARQQREELARRAARGRPLSELIIEERDVC